MTVFAKIYFKEDGALAQTIAKTDESFIWLRHKTVLDNSDVPALKRVVDYDSPTGVREIQHVMEESCCDHLYLVFEPGCKEEYELFKLRLEL